MSRRRGDAVAEGRPELTVRDDDRDRRQNSGAAGGAGHVTPPTPTTEPLCARAKDEPLYLRAEDVAAMLQVSKSSVFRLVKRDTSMPALVLGGIVRFPRERLLVWLRQREQGSTPRPRLKPIINPTPHSR